jgi:hypothetical protein
MASVHLHCLYDKARFPVGDLGCRHFQSNPFRQRWQMFVGAKKDEPASDHLWPSITLIFPKDVIEMYRPYDTSDPHGTKIMREVERIFARRTQQPYSRWSGNSTTQGCPRYVCIVKIPAASPVVGYAMYAAHARQPKPCEVKKCGTEEIILHLLDSSLLRGNV